jgi:hypothetical protein
MKFLISVIDGESASAKPDEMSAIDAFNDKLRANGHWVFAWGLEDPTASVVIDNRDGTNIIVSGPLVESPEWVSGVWIIEAPDYSTASQLALEGSHACNRRVELRPFHN